MLVVGCHCGIPFLRGGFVGVDVFFVLSGYLITQLLTHEYGSTGHIDFANFFLRRARRLLPACVVVIMAVTILSAAIQAPAEIEFTGRAAAAASVYVSNVFFDRSISDYFAPQAELNPLLHTWSLGVEEQFYLVWPFLLLLAFTQPKWIKGPLGMLGAVTGLSFAFSIAATNVDPTVAFYEIPARAWEFASGGLLTLVPVTKADAQSRVTLACGALGLSAILVAAVLVSGGEGFPGWIAILPVGGTVATLYAGSRAPHCGVNAILGVAPLRLLGARSYSWYLWHWPFIVFAAALFPALSTAGKMTTAFASLVVAALAYQLVERPIRERPRFKSTRLSLGGAVSGCVITVSASIALILFGQRLALDQRFKEITAATVDVGDISPKDCWSQGRSAEVKVCYFGASGAQKTIVLFGDSHAIQWFNPIRTSAGLEGWRLIVVVRPSCTASDINPHHLTAVNDICREWRAHAIVKIASLRPSAVVVASYSGATIRGYGTEAPITTEDLRAGTSSTFKKLSIIGVPIVVIRDTPLPPFPIPSCVARREISRPQVPELCDFDVSAANAPAFQAEKAAALGLANIRFLDLTDQFCGVASCQATQNKLLVYRDDNHLTGRFAESLSPIVRRRLFELLRAVQ